MKKTILRNNYRKAVEIMDFSEYMEKLKKDRSFYASPAERLLKAIGEPELINTKEDTRLSKIFGNETIKLYPAFKDFYGMEKTIENIVNYFKFVAQGLEEKKQILYLLGPVGGGKSSLVERIKYLMEKEPIYVLAFEVKDKEGNKIIQHSPVFESPLGLFSKENDAEMLLREYGVESRYIPSVASPWAIKRLDEIDGDESKIKVVKMYPCRLRQIAIAKTEPGDENNTDVGSLVGKLDLRKLNIYSQNDPDAYNYSGALCRGNQGVVDIVEIFKSPKDTLHPLLTATQEGNFTGTEEIGPIPFSGIILAHSNETEWKKFRNNPANEAFIDRIYKITVPYCLRYSDEVKIYKKMLSESNLKDAQTAPQTLETLAQWSVLTRLKDPSTGSIYTKMKIYNGDYIQNTDPAAKTYKDYVEEAGLNEGMFGSSTRTAFKLLSKTYNADNEEIAADPITLLYIIEEHIDNEQLSDDIKEKYKSFIKRYLVPNYFEFISNELRKAYLESYHDYGQNIFETYFTYADKWCDNEEYVDPETKQTFDREYLNKELEKIEKAANIANPKDFRFETVKWIYRRKADNDGRMPDWTEYEKLKDVIEKKMFETIDDLLPVISFSKKSSKEIEKKHEEFVDRMIKKGYTKKQIKRLVEWFIRVKTNR
jgi:serine protein kinase